MVPRITVKINGQEWERQAILALEEQRYRVVGRKLKVDMTGYSLEQMRQTLLDSKLRLGSQELAKICKKDTVLSGFTAQFLVALSGGKRTSSQIEIHATGLSAQEFIHWFEERNALADQVALLAAHPEHYVIDCQDKQMFVIERTGGAPMISEFTIDMGELEDLEKEFLPDYPHRIAGQAIDSKGRVIGAALHRFRDTEEGLEGILRIDFPKRTPKVIIEGHKKHLAIEFSNWMELAVSGRIE